MFLRKADAKPSAGGAIDHIGFSVADLDAKMKEWEAAGIKITTPARDVPGLFKLAFIEDPWGTRLEIVQDPELLGLHHLHLRNPNPDEGFAWLLDKFGGKRTQMKGRLDGVRYDFDGFSSVWILITKGEAEPSTGRALDHIGWRSGRSRTRSTGCAPRRLTSRRSHGRCRCQTVRRLTFPMSRAPRARASNWLKDRDSSRDSEDKQKNEAPLDSGFFVLLLIIRARAVR
jgi:hypothetical protein